MKNTRIADAADREYDAIVVGSGMTGGWAAKELCEKGLETVVLERGNFVEHGDYPTEHMPAWDMPYRGWGDRDLYEKEYGVQSQCYAFGEATRHFFVNDEQHPYVQETPFSWIRGYQLGGRSIMWGRQSYRLSDLDFEANKKDGYGVDWPIRYEDVEPWYSYVEKHVGISGEALGLPQLPDSEFLEPMEMNCVEKDAREKIESAFPKRDMTIGRVAVLTEQHDGRAPCHYCGPCHRGCSTGSYFSSLSSTLPAADATGNLTIACDAIVAEVLYDENEQRATGVRVIDRETGRSREVHAEVVFLCASALGSTQILLNSNAGGRFPDGMGNQSGALGHYLMDHIYAAGANGTFEGYEDDFYYGHRPNGIYIPRFRNLDGPSSDDLDFVRGYGYQGSARREGWGRGANQAGIGASLKQNLRRPGTWNMGLSGFGEMLPRYENRVELDSDETDPWGIPLLRVRCEHSENERKMKDDFLVQAQEMLDAAGAKDIGTYDRDAPPGLGIHEMGTARMGRDPDTSVLNGWNQVHSVPNVFVTDGACMTSSACQNPSLTYMALTARAADYAVKQLKKREL
jgi:choline dehydrogenase-like flavoprotein